jgi:transposase
VSKAIMSGTDMHDNTLVCRVAVGKEEPETRRYGNTARGRQQLFGHLEGVAKRCGCDRIIVAYEASTHGFCLYDDCRDRGMECFILAPTKMRKSKKDRKNKDDDRDAQLILETLRGHVLAGNELPSICIPDDETRADRETVRARLDLGHKLTGVKTQVQTLLKGNRTHKPKEAGKSWTKPYRRWLRSLCIKNEGWAALATLVRQIEALEGEIAILDEEVERLSETRRYAEASRALVEEIKGVGLLTAMVFLTEMGDLSRFSNRQQIGAFLGLVPSSNESGENDDRKGHITREGSGRLRRVLCQASWARVVHDPGESEVYDRIVRRNPKHKKIAVVATMRRLGIRMWHVGLVAQQKANVFPASETDAVDKAA